MQDVKPITWSGHRFLEEVGGDAMAFPLPRLLFLIARLRASGRAWMTYLADIRTVDFLDGQIVACRGFSNLLDSLEMASDSGEEVAALHARAIATGHSVDAIHGALSAALGEWFIEQGRREQLIVQFAANAPPPDQQLLSPIQTLPLLLDAVGKARTAEWVKAWLDENKDKLPDICIPDDVPRSEWGLGPMEIGVLGALESGTDMATLGGIGVMNWGTLAILIELGLVGAKEKNVAKPTANPRVQSQPAPPRPERTSSTPPSAPGPKSKARPGRKFLPVEPKVALSRVPWQSHPDEVETHLSDAYRAMNEAASEVVFALKLASDLETKKIESRFRELCARYHPDRYLNSSQAVRALAQGCFALVADAFQEVKLPSYQQQLRDRFIYAETGKKPVNDKTRARSRVDFKKAEMLYRQKRFSDAAKASSRAIEGDPDRPEYVLIHIRSAWNAQEMDSEDAVAQILALKGMDSRAMGEAYYQAGEMLLRDKQKKEAAKMFRKAVEVDPTNIGARRRIRLEQSRETASTDRKKPEKKGLFGGLFGPRKG